MTWGHACWCAQTVGNITSECVTQPPRPALASSVPKPVVVLGTGLELEHQMGDQCQGWIFVAAVQAEHVAFISWWVQVGESALGNSGS